MLSPQALIRGIVSKVLPPFNADNQNTDVALRMWEYGELAAMPLVRKAHVLADEGSYFVCHNNQTGTPASGNSAFTATAPFLIIQNQSTDQKRVYLDYISLLTTFAGSWASAGSDTSIAVQIDNILRYSSAGLNITANIVNANMGSTNTAPVFIFCGQVIAIAAGGQVRNLVGRRSVRPAASSTVIDLVGDNYIYNFGGVEQICGGYNGTPTARQQLQVGLPPVVAGPGHSILIYLFFPGTTVTPPSYIPEVGFWLR